MPKASLRLALSAVLVVPPAASAADAGLQSALDAVRPAAIGAHVRFLADDLLEGRDTGSRGHRIAARYVAAELEASGVLPAGDDGGYEQRVPLRSAEILEDETSLRLLGGGSARPLAYGRDYVLQPNFLEEDVRLEAPVVFVGFGVVAPDMGQDDYAGADVKGKIVAVLFGAPPRFPSEQRAHYGWPRLKAATAAARGAVGMLILRRPEAEQNFPWARVR